MSTGLSRVYDGDGNLTHVMCPFCFRYVPIADLWVDDEGQKWDTCGPDEKSCPPQ